MDKVRRRQESKEVRARIINLFLFFLEGGQSEDNKMKEREAEMLILAAREGGEAKTRKKRKTAVQQQQLTQANKAA